MLVNKHPIHENVHKLAENGKKCSKFICDISNSIDTKQWQQAVFIDVFLLATSSLKERNPHPQL
jgi:hypothetical protein